MMDAQLNTNEVMRKIRNNTLEEVAQEFEKIKAFGDTAHSFAQYVREMKSEE